MTSQAVSIPIASVVDGEPSADGEVALSSTNPWSGQEVAHGFAASSASVQRAVQKASEAARAWGDTSWTARGDALERIATVVGDRAVALADLIVREVGKPIVEARAEVERVVRTFEFYAHESRHARGQIIPASEPGVAVLTRRRPLGPVAVITPWNFPLAIPAWKIAPALLCGNPVLWKPSSDAAACAHALAECIVDAGLPAGTFSLLLGDAEVGEALLREPLAALSFTGSTDVGLRLRTLVAPRGVRTQLELGGCNVALVLDDADPSVAAEIARSAYGYAGQKCTATSVVLAERGIHEALVAGLVDATIGAPWGDPAREDVWGGPVITPVQAAKLRETVIGIVGAEGAELLASGPDLPGPAVMAPTLLGTAAEGQAPLDREIFGPVLTILEPADLDTLVARANASSFGLVASIYGRDIDRVRGLCNRLDVGVLAINRMSTGLEPQAPFGGWKGSGSPEPEQGVEALTFYTRGQTMYWKSTDAGAFP